jgi:hypothetical protein
LTGFVRYRKWERLWDLSFNFQTRTQAGNNLLGYEMRHCTGKCEGTGQHDNVYCATLFPIEVPLLKQKTVQVTCDSIISELFYYVWNHFHTYKIVAWYQILNPQSHDSSQ